MGEKRIKFNKKDELKIIYGADDGTSLLVDPLEGINLSAKNVTLNEHKTQNGIIKKVDVLGVRYDIHLKVPFESDDYLDGSDGYCDFHAKKIVIGDFSKKNGYEWSDLKAFENKVLRHELAHAFLYESGMNDLARDEKLVDWIAIQFPKLNKVFEEVGADE